MDYRIITAPVIIPDQYDCDQNKGEPPLTREQIRNLKETFDKDYQFIDYDHNLLDTTSEWYMKLVGEPVRSWITRKPTTYTNILGNTETIPSGTWWLTSKITDPTMIELLDDKLVTAYSITVGNKAFCDDMKRIIQTAPKNNQEQSLLDTAGLVATKNKTLIRDITDPVGFTVSLTGIPCVGSATFSKTCYEKQNKNLSQKNNGGPNMTEETKFSISELLGLQKLFATKSDEEKEEAEGAKSKATDKAPEQEEPKKEDEFVTQEEFQEAIDETNQKIEDIDNKIDEILKKLEPEKEEENEEKQKDQEEASKEDEEKDEGVDKSKTAKKHNPLSSQLDNSDDAHNQNIANKNNNSKAKLMGALNRKSNGEYKFPRVY